MVIRILATLLLLPVFAQAQMHRWLDDSGKVHYSDQAPPSSAKNVQKKSAMASPSASPPLPYALQQAVKDFPVTLYTSEPCIPCVQARELLNKRGVPYKEVGVIDNEGLEKLKKLTGATSVPVMTVGREAYKGFERATYQAALDNARYPRTSQLPAGAQAREIVKPAEKPAPVASAGESKPAADAEQAPDAGASK
ncbi:MAG: glutaredoxin family protein [Pseudomonadota bacterium]